MLLSDTVICSFPIGVTPILLEDSKYFQEFTSKSRKVGGIGILGSGGVGSIGVLGSKGIEG